MQVNKQITFIIQKNTNSTHVTSIQHYLSPNEHRQELQVDMIRSTTEGRTDNTISHYGRMFSPYHVTTNMMHLLHFTPTSKSFLYQILPVTCICKFTKPNFKTRNIYVWICVRFTPTIWQRVNCRITTGGSTIHHHMNLSGLQFRNIISAA